MMRLRVDGTDGKDDWADRLVPPIMTTHGCVAER